MSTLAVVVRQQAAQQAFRLFTASFSEVLRSRLTTLKGKD